LIQWPLRHEILSQSARGGVGRTMPDYRIFLLEGGLTDGKQVLNNHKGIDLSGNAAAP
jgi:hypothetical protein